MDRGTALSGELGSDHSIALYRVITCCGWIRGGAFGCPDSEAASGVRNEDIFLAEAFADELLEVFSEAPTVGGLVPLTVMIGAVLFCSKK